MIPFHPPTLASFGAVFALLAATACEALLDVRVMSAGLQQLVSYGVFCGSPFWRFISFEAPEPELSLIPSR
jgi:hypothetical protein